MTIVKVAFELPETLAQHLGHSEPEVAHRVFELTLVQLFRQGAISSGKAAELLGVSKAEFRKLLRKQGFPYFNLTPDELRSEIEASKKAEVRRAP